MPCVCLTNFLQVFHFWHAKTLTKKKKNLQKKHIDWHTQFRSWHVLWLVKKKHTRQLTCKKLKGHVLLGHLGITNYILSIRKTDPITIWELPTLTYILKFSLVLVIFFVTTVEMVIREVVEAKYKGKKTIVHGLLRMYFHDSYVQVFEWTIWSCRSRRVVHALNDHFPDLLVFNAAKLFNPRNYPSDDNDRITNPNCGSKGYYKSFNTSKKKVTCVRENSWNLRNTSTWVWEWNNIWDLAHVW